jgi:hypothetical protein
MSTFQSCVVAEVIINTFLPIVKLRVLNQSQGYRLLLDALSFAFDLCIIMKVNMSRIQALQYLLIH